MENGVSAGVYVRCTIKRANGEVIDAPKDDKNPAVPDASVDADRNVPVGVPGNPPRGDAS